MSVIVKWLGHASFQIKANGKNIYIDPYEGEYAEKADLVLVTHSHFDHCDTSKIEKVTKKDTVIICPPECVSRLSGNVKAIKPGEKIEVDGVTVEAVHAYNYKRFRSPGNPFHPKGFGLSLIHI